GLPTRASGGASGSLGLEPMVRDLEFFGRRAVGGCGERWSAPLHGEGVGQVPGPQSAPVQGQHGDGRRASLQLVAVAGIALSRRLLEPGKQVVALDDAPLQRDVRPAHAPRELVDELVLATLLDRLDLDLDRKAVDLAELTDLHAVY